MTRPDPSDVSLALTALSSAGFTWKSDDGGELREHLARHAPDSLTVGSKYSPQAWANLDALHEQASALAIIALARAHQEGHPLRCEITVPYPHAGREGVVSGLVCAGLSTLTRSKIVRDPGTVYEQAVEVVVVADDQEFPTASQVIAPAGQLWDKPELGLYSLFPGSASRPFPRDEQALTDPEFHQANVAFWKTHCFIARPREVLHALQASLDSIQYNTHAQEMVDYHRGEIARVSALHQQYQALAHTRLRP